MSPSFFFVRARTGLVRVRLLMSLSLAVIAPLWLWAQAPAWWAERGVLNTEAAADDYAVVNQGQVKHIAKQAYEEMKEKLPGGAGPALDAIWADPTQSNDDYVAINVGQLKNVAKPFYDRLQAVDYSGHPLASGQVYPWDGAALADDYALVNIGQVKNLFSFVLPEGVGDPTDTAGNGLPDAWEIEYFGQIGVDPAADPDGDGLTNRVEYFLGTDPTQTAQVVSGPILELVIFAP